MVTFRKLSGLLIVKKRLHLGERERANGPAADVVQCTKPLAWPPGGREVNAVWPPGLHLPHRVSKSVSEQLLLQPCQFNTYCHDSLSQKLKRLNKPRKPRIKFPLPPRGVSSRYSDAHGLPASSHRSPWRQDTFCPNGSGYTGSSRCNALWKGSIKSVK